ncbi:hypothetical protein [Vibrio casei]|uniref:hypothetical protein n=1 Tax=Vibrio casei TaxID=673372 RepID=UPI000DA65A6B|nr:hypothetical protein [Vibrio casei]
MKRQLILNPNNTRSLNTIIINDLEYVLDKFELKKYNQYKIEGNPTKEEMFLIWLENYQTLKYSIYINSSPNHLPSKIKSVA